MMPRWTRFMPSSLQRRRVLFAALAAAVLAAVGGCATDAQTPPPIPEIRFLSEPPIRLKASAIDIVDDTLSATSALEWGNIFRTLPRAAMRNWARDRLVADPLATETALFRITEAAIEYSAGDKVKGVFKPDRREKFLIRVAANLDIRRADGSLAKTISGKAWGAESILVDEEPAARKLAIDGLVRRVMADFDREMTASIRANMADLTR